MKKKLFPILILLFSILVIAPSIPVNASTFDPGFDISSKGVLLTNLDTGAAVYAKNADERLEPASCTKIMTYIIAEENIPDLNTVITVPTDINDQLAETGSSLAGLLPGEQLTALQLLNCMMIPSGNDAALTLAEYVGGGDSSVFVQKMNDKAAELGCTGTHFANPHGLHDDNHYTTATDLTKIAQFAMTLPDFTDITNQTSYTIPATNMSATSRSIFTTNYMITKNESDYYYQYAKGIKTGSHEQAGYCLVSTAEADGVSYMCVALDAPYLDASGNQIMTRGEMIDTKNLYRWAYRNLSAKTLVRSTDNLAEVHLNYAWGKQTVLVAPEKDYTTMLPNDVSESSVVITPHVPDSIDAPVKQGDVVGTATISYAGQDLTTINLVATSSAEKSQILAIWSTIHKIITSIWFIVIATLLIILLIIYIILTLTYNKKKKTMIKSKRYKNN